MEFLPLRFVHHDDIRVVGRELVDLAAIRRLGFPVPDGLVLFAPEIPFKEVLKAYRGHDSDRFEQSLTIFKSQLFKVSPPIGLKEELKKYRLDVAIVWKDCLNRWIEQIRSRVWRHGLVGDSILDELPVQAVFFIGKTRANGTAFFRLSEGKVVIQIQNGQLSTAEQEQIEKLVERLKKKVLTHYIFDWVIDSSGVFITKVLPYIEENSFKEPIEQIEIKAVLPQSPPNTKQIKTSLKIFADLSEGLVLEKDIDGVFLASEKIETDDQKILKLVESGFATHESVVFQLSNQKDTRDVSSVLRLLHQPELLAREVRTFQFAKHNYTKQTLTDLGVLKQSLLHLQIGLPTVRSVGELKQIKSELKELGVERRGNQKLFVEFSVPENWVNFDSYLKEGFDGVVVDVEELYCSLIGVLNLEEHPFYQFDPKIVVQFLELFTSLLKKSELMILFKGEHVLDDDIVKFGLRCGVAGVILNQIQIQGAREFISRLEKHHILDKQVVL